MIEYKVIGTSYFGVGYWKSGEFLRMLEINTFIVDLHISLDFTGKIEISIGVLRLFRFGINISGGNGV
jgi:hypothetical protein